MGTVSREAKLYVRDKATREIFHIEEKYSSLVWTERYQESGEFVLDIPLNAANINTYSIGNFLSFDNSNESMVILSRTINDEVDEPTLEVTGKSLSNILSRRVNASRIFELLSGSVTYMGKVGTVMQSMFNDEIINPQLPTYGYFHHPDNLPLRFSNSDRVSGYYEPGGNFGRFCAYNEIKKIENPADYRKIDKFIFKDSTDGTIDINTSFTEIKTIYDIMVKIAKNNYLGFKSYFDDDLNIVIEIYSGMDRTSGQKTLNPVVFDPIMDNISYLGYFEDATEYKSSGFVYTDGVLIYREKGFIGVPSYARYDIFPGYMWHDATGKLETGLDRFEVPFDVRNSVSVNDLKENPDPEMMYGEDSEEAENSGTAGWTSGEWYKWWDTILENVANAGSSAYEEGDYDYVQTSEGTIDPLVRYEFEKDYNIGDKVDITNGDYGIAMTAYIDEAVKSYDDSGWIITPNFKNILDYDTGEEDS